MQRAELRPLGIGEILDVSIKLYLRNALTLIKIVALFVVPVGLLTILFQILTAPETTTVRDGQLVLPTQGSLGAFIGQSLILGLLGFLATLLATGAAFKAVGDAYVGRVPGAGASIRFIGSRASSLVWVSILLIFIIYVGFILLIIPGIYLLGSLLVTVPALLFENLKGGKALHRSRELTRGRWWQSFAVLFLGIFLLTLVVQAVIGFLLQALILRSVESVGSYFALSGVGGLIGSLLTTPLQACIITVLYFDLRVRKEGLDLQQLEESIGRGEEPTGASPDARPSPPPGARPSPPPGTGPTTPPAPPPPAAPPPR